MNVPEGQHISRLTPLASVFEQLAVLAHPIAPSQLDVDRAAAGLVLATHVTSGRAWPSRATAFRDGWAVSAEALGDAGAYAPVLLEPAPAFVDIGDPMPSGADAVLPRDALVVRNGTTEAMAAIAPGDGVLAAGANADAGAVLLRGGVMLREVDIAVLRAGGISHVSVRTPRLRLVCASHTGERDVVASLIARGVFAAGGTVVFDPRRIGPEALHSALSAKGQDAVISIGGTGEGRNDSSIRTLASAGSLAVHGIGLRPGETTALGAAGGRPVLMLPGRLEAALAAWVVVGRRFMGRLTGFTGSGPSRTATLARKIVSTIGLGEVVPVGVCEGGIEPLASDHWPWRALTHAAGWVFVSPDSEGYAAGSLVEVMPFP